MEEKEGKEGNDHAGPEESVFQVGEGGVEEEEGRGRGVGRREGGG